MAYDETLAARIRQALAPRPDIDQRKMFGGIGFMLSGNMCCGVAGERLMLRLGNEGAAAALREPHTRPMDFTGKPLKSMVYVDLEGIASPEDLNRWVNRAADFAAALPPKSLPQPALRNSENRPGKTPEAAFSSRATS
jgi:TfoX/Sxy family transcriptional regulator of competence genes